MSEVPLYHEKATSVSQWSGKREQAIWGVFCLSKERSGTLYRVEAAPPKPERGGNAAGERGVPIIRTCSPQGA